MPFCGRPSDACAPCRKGRLKCDRLRPFCSQCRRKSIICSGYRDVPLLLFRDESEATARKVHWKQSRNVTPPASSQQPSRDAQRLAAPDFTNLPIITSPTPPPAQSRVELALSYFLSSYVPISPFDYLPEFYRATATTEQDVLSSAVLAPAFASVSHFSGDSQHMIYARSYYSKALKRTNSALASPSTSTLDSTLISVLLLGLYEAIAFSGTRSPASWTAHTLGAVELIRLRGVEHLDTALGRRLFVQAGNHIRSSCIYRNVAVPNEFLKLQQQVEPFLDFRLPVVRLGPFLDRIASFNARLRAAVGAQELPEIVRTAMRLEKEARQLESKMEHPWTFEILPPHLAPPCAYRGLAHRFPAYRVARHWNALRVLRIFMNEVAWHVVAAYTEAKKKETTESSQICEELDVEAIQSEVKSNMATLVSDVLATVPHFLDDEGKTFTPAARFLIWPLTVVGRSSLSSESARKYILERLYDIGSQARVPQALQATKAVESRGIDDWTYLYQFG